MKEIFLTKKCASKEEWDNLIKRILKYSSVFGVIKIYVQVSNNYMKFYLDTLENIPAHLEGLDSFLFKDVEGFEFKSTNKRHIFISCNNINNLKEEITIKKRETLEHVEIIIKKSFRNFKYKINVITNKYKYLLLFNNPSNLLTVNFKGSVDVLPSGSPKYLDIAKVKPILSDNSDNALFKVDTYPFNDKNLYLSNDNYNFNLHSLIVGSSGSGKSKFISLFATNALKCKDKYKVVIIDPHAAIEDDIGGLAKVIDFQDSSIDLFKSDDDIIINLELLMELIANLIGKSNKKVERVLRHSIYILLVAKLFNFNTLKNVILDIEYRNNLINMHKRDLPISVVEFFASEFNDIKTKSYMEAISPIISLVDELSMLPVFSQSDFKDDLLSTIQDNDLTIFSLDRMKLGNKITKTLSGLIMEQLLTELQKKKINEHVIFIIDEISVIENPILSIFLSEARKYNLSLILAGQYFDQVSDDLKNSIFANVINYYIFRVSRIDASTLIKNINIKIPLSDDDETKINLLTGLKMRECIARVSENGVLFPALKGITVDLKSIPRIKIKNDKEMTINENKQSSNFSFSIDNGIDLTEILRKSSTSRKVDNNG